MMRNFVFLFLIAAGQAKTIEKRSLVSRFTSNPFFLSHFSDSYYQSRPWTVDYDNVSPVEEADYDNEEESEEPTQVRFFIKENDSPSTEKPEKIEEAGPAFNSLPLFERTVVFWNKSEDEEVKMANGKEETKQTGENDVVYLFNSLPLYDRKKVFNEEKHSSETVRNEEKKPKIALTYIFNSLPLYDRSYSFLENPPTLFVSEEISPSGRKVLKLIRRRKIEKKMESVANLPLENFHNVSNYLFNSYGGLLSPTS